MSRQAQCIKGRHEVPRSHGTVLVQIPTIKSHMDSRSILQSVKNLMTEFTSHECTCQLQKLLVALGSGSFLRLVRYQVTSWL